MTIDEGVHYQVKVLGPVAVAGPEGQVDPGGTKPRLLLSLLVANAGSVVSTERLIDGLWGDDPPSTARKTLHVHVSNVRRLLGVGFPLETTRAGYRLDCERVDIDSVRFEAGLARGTALLLSSPGDAADVLADALQLWSGPAYADLADQDAIRPEATRLTELRLNAIEHRIDADLRVGRHKTLLGELETLTTDHPFRERFRALQMLALYRSSRQADALRTYDRTRSVLADELGLDPGPELRVLYQQILDQSPELDLVIDTSVAAAIERDPPTSACGRRTVRGYELRERLGGHGDGSVFRAYQAALGREVAIRVIPPAESNRPDFVKGFEASCQLVADLSHPHIVGLYDFWRDPDGAYVAMPLLRGGSLEHSLERTLWHPPAALRAVDQIGSALGYAHRRGIAHGDVRASNVLLDEDGNAYLSDFVVVGRDAGQLDDAEHASGVAGDVRGLAVITCVMLTGAEPDAAGFTRVSLASGLVDLIQSATDPQRGFSRVDDYLRGLRRCFGADSVTSVDAHARSDTRNPFKGLRAFGETDANDFFGRDDLVCELVERVATEGLTAVIGPSGSGKSSLVKAGLVPACRRRGLGTGRDLVIAEMLPGPYPFEELERALMTVAVDRPDGLLSELGADDGGLLRAAKRVLPDDDTDLLLIIDQFEELFALTSDSSVRRMFLANLATVARDPSHRVRVVVTLRADFFDRPLMNPDFGEIMKESITTVTLPGEASLAEAIAGPVRRVGLEIEPGLVPTILRDVADQPGSLPMLQYALTELVEIRDGDVLTIDAYRRTGGVVGALATRAEEIFESLTPAARDVAREVFVRLVSVGDENDDTRRRVRRTELEGLGIDPVTLETVIDAFGSFRLLTFDHDPITRGPTVEVAHEALIREWPRFGGWIDDRRDDLRAEQRLASATSEWLAAGRDPSFLVGGARLDRYEQWIGSSSIRPTGDERDFITASQGNERQQLTRAASRRRRVLVGASVLTAIALVAAIVAFVQRNRADDEARAATEAAEAADRLRVEAERSAALDRAQAAMARISVQKDPDLRILLTLAEHDALAADGLTAPAVTSALYQSVFDQRISHRLPAFDVESGLDRPVTVEPIRDGSLVAIGRSGGAAVSIMNPTTGEVTATIDPAEPVVASMWDPDQELVVIGRYDGVVEFWEPTGELVDSFDIASRPVWPLSIGEGLIVLAEYPRTELKDFSNNADFGPFSLVAYDPAAEREVFRTPMAVQLATVSPARDRMAVVENQELRIYDTARWTDVTPDRLRRTFEPGSRVDIEWSGSGHELWLLQDDRISRFDTRTGEEAGRIESELTRLVYMLGSLDGRLLAVAGSRTSVRVFDTQSGELVAELLAANRDGTANINYPSAMTWTADRRLVVALGDSTVVWNLDQPTTGADFWPERAMAADFAAITPAGDRILGSRNGGADVFDPSGRLRSSRAATRNPTTFAVASADGSVLAVPGDVSVEFVDPSTNRVLALGPPGLTRPLALSHDGRHAVLGTSLEPDDRQHRVVIFDTTTGEQTVLGGGFDGGRAAFTSDGRQVAIPITSNARYVDAETSVIRVFDVATGRILGANRVQDCITAVAMSHDDSVVASLGCGGDVALLDYATLTGDEPWTAAIGIDADDTSPAVGVTFDPDDELVIVTRRDGRVEAYSADEGFEKLWTFDLGNQAGTPSVHDGMVWVGATYALGSESPRYGMVAMPLDPQELVTLARETVTRALSSEECEEFLAETAC